MDFDNRILSGQNAHNLIAVSWKIPEKVWAKELYGTKSFELGELCYPMK